MCFTDKWTTKVIFLLLLSLFSHDDNRVNEGINQSPNGMNQRRRVLNLTGVGSMIQVVPTDCPPYGRRSKSCESEHIATRPNGIFLVTGLCYVKQNFFWNVLSASKGVTSDWDQQLQWTPVIRLLTASYTWWRKQISSPKRCIWHRECSASYLEVNEMQFSVPLHTPKETKKEG
jgi:hypothetical protein